MDDRLLAAYRRTDYRVRLPGGGTACLHIDAALPEALRPWVGTGPWGLITAWHPGSQPAPAVVNRAAQRRLLNILRADPGTRRILVAAGVGAGCWREPSLFAIGTPHGSLGRLAYAFGQLAHLAGTGPGPVRLVWTAELT
ncbi:MAG: DUF3293 domain-containing protein [Xanthomonadaceae bacterium]|nr:DUF3293 domain-containing protein [Xanthomonadaceae bacterium]MDE1963494.1 DUF3293 domain-containing protein [Xanthomonadaceae bacterium]